MTFIKYIGLILRNPFRNKTSGAYVSLTQLQNISKKEYINQILIKTTEGANDKEISDYIENKYLNELSTITTEERA